MRSDIEEKVAVDLLTIPPLIFRGVRRKLIKTTLADIDEDVSITPHHFEIMRLLEDEGTLHVCEIGERLQIARAQMTSLIDRLTELDMVGKEIDTADRRTFNISLSGRGKNILEEHKNSLIRAVREGISRLTDEELADLSNSLIKLRDILSKLQ